MGRVQARWLDLGQLSPDRLHASYQGIAEAAGPDAAPVLLWGISARPHLSLGASQGADAELDRGACRTRGIDLIQRPLGGGTVLVDAGQYCFFLLFPGRHRPGRHQRLFDLALAPALAVFHALGLPARRVGATDLWIGNRKILGSGAATLGTTMVFGSSFLLDFDHGLFASLVKARSDGFRDWLVEELRAGMTCWREHAVPPAAELVQQSLRSAVREQLGWDTVASALTPAEQAAIEAAREELQSPLDEGPERRLIADGIKVNHGRYLVETQDAEGWLRLAIADRAIRRIATESAPDLQIAVGCEPERDRLAARLDGSLPPAQAAYWAERIDAAAAGVRRVWDG